MTYNDYKAALKKASKYLKKSAVDEIASGQFSELSCAKKRTVDITVRCGAQFSDDIYYHAQNNDGHVTKIKKIGAGQRRAGVSVKDAQAASMSLAEAVCRWTEEKGIHRSVREIRRWSSSQKVRHDGYGYTNVHDVRIFKTTSKLAEQLDAERKMGVSDHIDHGANGSVNVQWVSTPDECGISVNEEQDWDGYSRSCKYPMTFRTVTVRAVIENRGNFLGGDRRIRNDSPDLDCVALSCKPITPPELDVDIQAYDAVTATKKRGISYEVRRAIILASDYRGRHVVAGENMDDAVARLRKAAAKGWGDSIIDNLDVEAVRNDLLAGNIEVNQDIACELIRAIEMYAPSAGDIKGMIKLLVGLDDSGALSDAGILHAVAANPEIKLLDLHSVVLTKFRDEINSVRDGNTSLDILVDRQASEKLINLYLDHGADETLLNARRSVDFDRIMGSRTQNRPPAQATGPVPGSLERI